MAQKVLSNLDFGKNEVQNARVQNLASAPSSPVTGQLYYDTVSNLLFFWNGTSWISSGGGSGIPATIVDVKGDIIAATAADTVARLPAGADNTLLVAASGQSTGLQWRALVAADIQEKIATADLTDWPRTASLDLNSQKIINQLDPTNPQDSATKAYVDAARTGLDVKASVRAASTASVTVTYTATAGTSARGQITAAPNTLDGVTLAANDRILLKDQSTGAQNGIWAITTLGTGANGVWDRATDFDADAEVTSGAYTFVTEGTVNDNSGWMLITNDPIIIGGASGTALVWVQFTGAGQLTAGTGITKTGNTLAVDNTLFMRRAAFNVGDGSSTTITLTHNFGTRDIGVSLIEAASLWSIPEVEKRATTTNTVDLIFGVAPATNFYRALVFA